MRQRYVSQEEGMKFGEDEATLRARNIPYIPPRDLDSAYELTQAIEQATTQQIPREVPVFGDLLWIERTKPKKIPGRCITR